MEVVIGEDGHRYKPLSLEEAKDLCRDVRFYKMVDPLSYYRGDSVPIEFVRSAYEPEMYREEYISDRLNMWYNGGEVYYVLLDDDKPEYEPI